MPSLVNDVSHLSVYLSSRRALCVWASACRSSCVSIKWRSDHDHDFSSRTDIDHEHFIMLDLRRRRLRWVNWNQNMTNGRHASLLCRSTANDIARSRVLGLLSTPTAVAGVGFSPLCVCLFLRTIFQKPMQLRSPNVWHTNDESWKPIYFGVKRSKIKVTSHNMSVSVFGQNAILPLAAYVSHAGFSVL